MKITLIQPQYPHGNRKQIYLPGGLMNLGSRLIHAGLEVDFIDLNHQTWKIEAMFSNDLIGFTVLGHPYIPVVIQTIKEMRTTGLNQPILIGGEGVSRLRPQDFSRWFEGLGAIQVRTDHELASACGIPPSKIPSAYNTSTVSMLRRLNNDQLRQYLTTELPLFISQGCLFSCAFCAAAKAQRETYRTSESLYEELQFICDYLQKVGHLELRVYVTNLDCLQTPAEFEKRLEIIGVVAREHGLVPHVRGLATSRCTVVACRKDPGLAERLRMQGFCIIAFGADGADEQTWRREGKLHNSLSELQEASRYMEEAGIQIEFLMVIGFQGDGVRALRKDLSFSFREAFRGRVIRPYLAKHKTPSGRWPDNDPEVEVFLEDVNLLTRLDYAMIGSEHTHPVRWQRWMSNFVYLLIIGLLAPFGRCPTRPLFPIPKGWIRRWITTTINGLMPFDR